MSEPSEEIVDMADSLVHDILTILDKGSHHEGRGDHKKLILSDHVNLKTEQ